MTFHYLFGPWAIIISSLVVDTMKFFVILMLFESGFCMLVIAMNQPYSVHVGLSGDAEKEQAFIQSSHGMLYKILQLLARRRWGEGHNICAQG